MRNSTIAANRTEPNDRSDLRELQSVPTPSHPIGITYDATMSRVRVACYSGEILVFGDA